MDVNLETYRTAPSKVFSGRKRGRKIRKTLNLDSIDDSNEPVRFIIPADIISLNPSFILGLLGPSIRKLGLESFNSRYSFVGDEVHAGNIEEGKKRALNEKNVLADESDDDSEE